MVRRSHRIGIEWNRVRDDVFVSTCRFSKGARVSFEIPRDARWRLENVFEKFAPAPCDYPFQKTRALVRLLRRDYVSRSEAKRLLLNLDRFSEVELDVAGVEHAGQGFADEVFRVFASRHPGTEIRVVNANAVVSAMIRHVARSGD